MLSDAGMHIIDMGFPSAAPSERRALELILEGKKKGRLRPDLEIIVMCRSNARDIDVTLDTLEKMGAKPHDCTFFIFTSGSDLHLKYKIGKTLLALEGRKAEEWLDLPVSLLPRGQHQDGVRGDRARAQPRRPGDRVRRGGRLARRRRLPDRAREGLLRGGRDALLLPRHGRLLRAGRSRLLHPEARGRVPREAARRPLPQRLRPRRLQHRARPAPRSHDPHLHGERPRRAGGQRAPAHDGDDPEGALRGDRPRLPLRHAVGPPAEGGGDERSPRRRRASPSSATTSSATRPGSTPRASRSTPRSTR